MNIIQKQKTKTVKIYLAEEDLSSPPKSVIGALIDSFGLAPEGYSMSLQIDELEDLPLELTGILLAFLKTAKEKNLPVTLFSSSKLSDLVLSLKTGDLLFSLETIG